MSSRDKKPAAPAAPTADAQAPAAASPSHVEAPPPPGTDVTPKSVARRTGLLPPELRGPPQNSSLVETSLSYLKAYDIPLAQICFSADNHNRQSEKQFRATCESLALHGFVEPCLVRPFTDEELQAFVALEPGSSAGDFSNHQEMVNGEHRTRAIAQWIELGLPADAHESLRSLVERKVVPCHVVEMSPEWAAHLRIVLSFGGETDFRKLGEVLQRLDGSLGGIEKLKTALPWDVEHLKEIIAAGAFDWEKYKADLEANKGGGKDGGGADLIFKVSVEAPKAAREVFVQELRALCERHSGKFKVKG